MEIIPAIDLLQGNCVRLHKGEYDKVTHFSSDPVSQALSWQSAGAKRLHLVDLDGAREGESKNDESIQKVVNALKIPVQVGGGIRSSERVDELIAYGLDKIIVGTLAIERPDIVKTIVDRHPQRIIIGIDAKDGYVSTKGWTNQSAKLATELATELSQLDIASIITTDIATDGTLEGPNLDAMRLIAEASRVPVIASGGVGSMADLLSLISLEEVGVSGIIVGRALYEKKLDLGEAINALKNDRIRDTNISNEFFA